MENLTLEVVGLLILLATIVERATEAATGLYKAIGRSMFNGDHYLRTAEGSANVMKPVALVTSAAFAWALVWGLDFNLVSGVGIEGDDGKVLTLAIIALGSDPVHQLMSRVQK